MRIETNLILIALEAEARWADNWNFRAYLQQEVAPFEIDIKVLALNEKVSSAIDCTQCGNCCREIYPHMTEGDTQRLAQGMNISMAELNSQVTKKDDALIFCEKPCPLLKENKCSVYTYRPDDCREYPHLHQSDFLGNSISTIENYRVCPIVFNVYNQLKACFAYNPEKDYIGDSDPEAT